MSIEEVPVARRVRRPTWRDPRLGVGVLLVAGSVALGTWAVQDAAAAEQVYVARQTLTPGTVLDEEALMVVEARPPAPGQTYLRVADELPSGAVTTRVLGAGEMVPRAAVGAPDDVGLRPLVVPVSTALPGDLAPGATVDLWFTATGALPEAARPEPELLAPGLLLAGIVEEDSVFTATGGAGASVELLVPDDDVPGVLAALAQDAELVVVPTPGGQRGTVTG